MERNCPDDETAWYGGPWVIAIGGGADGECDVPQERSSTTVRWGGGLAPLPCLYPVGLYL
ncbi:hypothetical protein [Methanoculleus submarinus]|uniref:Uncharacterized protein n=2 Tax=Methanoculleus TaxID=45989 RepID=A3CSR7_METMJ|nr:hypothetical protein [Methanoculleus submarinus]ABN56417.1 hypothetical protein Memar_0484 [Methanoculleus marisnigri JR1]UYU17864.1 hypothetical protein OH143_09135 [Methanoculleus submarinus]